MRCNPFFAPKSSTMMGSSLKETHFKTSFLFVRLLSLLLFATLFFGQQALAHTLSFACDMISSESSHTHDCCDTQAAETDSRSSESGTCPNLAHCHHHTSNVTPIPSVTPFEDLFSVQIEDQLAFDKIWTPSEHISELFRPPTRA